MSEPKGHRKSLRLPGFDYRTPTAYYVTICVLNRAPLFGAVVDGEVQPSDFGQIAERMITELPARYPLVEIDAFVIMPDHIHLILFLKNEEGGSRPAPTQRKVKPLGAIVGMLKMLIAKEINRIRGTAGTSIWQRNYYEHIIAHTDELNQIRTYILSNPMRWKPGPEHN